MKLSFYAAFLCAGAMLSPTLALSDGFGDRFQGETPVGLMHYTMPEAEYQLIVMEEAARAAQEIMPAAGDEKADASGQEQEASARKHTNKKN